MEAITRLENIIDKTKGLILLIDYVEKSCQDLEPYVYFEDDRNYEADLNGAHRLLDYIKGEEKYLGPPPVGSKRGPLEVLEKELDYYLDALAIPLKRCQEVTKGIVKVQQSYRERYYSPEGEGFRKTQQRATGQYGMKQ